MKKYLVLGGTGAMGIHLCASLATEGAQVIVTSRRTMQSDNPNISYVRGDAKDPAFLKSLLENDSWDAIIDFMVWSTDEFVDRAEQLLTATNQYCFISSYRVYSDSSPITEDSPRLLDTVADEEYLATDEYALSKARCEDILFRSGRENWTILRPAITYDGSGRFQLGVYEAVEWLPRARQGIPIPFPEEMLSKSTTMSWGGDVARMISLLVGNTQAYGEVFTVSTAEFVTWRQVCSFYSDRIPLRVAPCRMEDFDRLYPKRKYQIHYDRMFDRIIDNSKMLKVTGLNNTDFLSAEEGLSKELGLFLDLEAEQDIRPGMQGRFDRLTGGCPSAEWVCKDSGLVGIMQYAVRRCFFSPAI